MQDYDTKNRRIIRKESEKNKYTIRFSIITK